MVIVIDEDETYSTLLIRKYEIVTTVTIFFNIT